MHGSVDTPPHVKVKRNDARKQTNNHIPGTYTNGAPWASDAVRERSAHHPGVLSQDTLPFRRGDICILPQKVQNATQPVHKADSLFQIIIVSGGCEREQERDRGWRISSLGPASQPSLWRWRRGECGGGCLMTETM